MADVRASKSGAALALPDATRAAAEERVEQARESISEIAEHIKDTVGAQVESVATTVSGVLSMSEHFQRDPVVWSLGALSAGFALGYGLGRAHHAATKRGRPSPFAQLADDVAAELATLGSSLVSPALGAELKATFGVDLTTALAHIATQAKAADRAPRPTRATKRVGKRVRRRSTKGRTR
jgi:hypothetical protein